MKESKGLPSHEKKTLFSPSKNGKKVSKDKEYDLTN